MIEAFAKIRDTVLTDEQRKKLEEMRKRFMRRPSPGGLAPRELNLSDEQRKTIKEIIADARGRATEADSHEARREIFRAAHKKIVEEVLTDEQRTKAKELRDRWRKRRHSRGRGGRRGRGGPGEDAGEGDL